MTFEVIIDLSDWKIIQIKEPDDFYGAYNLVHNCNTFPRNITTHTAKRFHKCVYCSTPVPNDVSAIIHTLRPE